MFKIIFAFGAIAAVFFTVLFVGFPALILVVTSSAVSRRREAKETYRQALEAYRRQPFHAALRQAALEAGRLYSRSTRNGYGNAYFDEAALRNDLDAVEAAAAPVVVHAPAPAKQAIAERLATLDGLWNQGLVTEDEYRDRRTAILNDV